MVAPAGWPASTFMFISAHTRTLHLALVLRPSTLLYWRGCVSHANPIFPKGIQIYAPPPSPGSQLGRKTRTGFVIVIIILMSSLLPLVQYILLMFADITDFQDVTPCSLVRLRCTFLHIYQAIRRCILHSGVARGGGGRMVPPPRAADSKRQQSGRKNSFMTKILFSSLKFSII